METRRFEVFFFDYVEKYYESDKKLEVITKENWLKEDKTIVFSSIHYKKLFSSQLLISRFQQLLLKFRKKMQEPNPLLNKIILPIRVFIQLVNN
jgi:hypothetical protein